MGKIDFEKELNAQQWEAVRYCDGPALVIAGAGSGKTRVLTYKLAYLLEQGYPAHSLIALTFTNKAAREMCHRVESMLPRERTRGLRVGTFHSIFASFLRQRAPLLGFQSNFSIYDTSDARSVLKQIVDSLSLDSKLYVPKQLLHTISAAKNALISPEAYASDRQQALIDRYRGWPRMAEIYALYQAQLRAANAMDFDDLLFEMGRLLRDFPEVKAEMQQQLGYLLIDEYQDTNPVQYYICVQLAEASGRIFAVGDDAQSIYSFRGANVQNILSFQQSFRGAKIFKLEENYRSTQTIVKLANSLIERNQERIEKEVFSNRHEGEKISVAEYETAIGEAESIAAHIYRRSLRDPSYDYNECAILYRTHAQSRLFEKELRALGIPYRIHGGMAFFARAEIKDLMAWLELLVNPRNDQAFTRAAQVPRRGIGAKSMNTLISYAQAQQISLFDAAALAPSIPQMPKVGGKSLVELWELLGKLAKGDYEDLTSLVRGLIAESGMAAELARETDSEAEARQQNVAEFLTSVREFQQTFEQQFGDMEQSLFSDDRSPILAQLGLFLQGISLVTDADNELGTSDAAVRLMTIHAAKGLEFEDVYVTGLEEGLFPSMMSTAPGEIEEERRLLYVAITRAKEHCTISLARSRMRNGQTEFMLPSRFLKDLDYAHINLHSDTLSWQLETTPKKAPMPLRPPTRSTINPAAPIPSGTLSTAQAGFAKNVDVVPGEKVEHASFGRGVIDRVEGEGPNKMAYVTFEEVGQKKLMLRFALLRVLSPSE